MKYRRPAIILVLVVITGAVVFALLTRHSESGQIDIQAAPGDSSVSLDGRSVGLGLRSVKPGLYKIVISRSGFASQSQNVNVKKNDTKYVGIILSPNSSSTADWYSTHPTDERLAEAISSKNFDLDTNKQIAKLPLIKDLPFVDQLYRVDYGNSKLHPNDPTAVAIYIKYYSSEGKQQALDWLKFKGYDPSKLEVIYTDANHNN